MQSTAAKCRITDLPDELVVLIVEYLPQEALGSLVKVAGRFYELCIDRLWTTPTIVSMRQLEAFLKAGGSRLGEEMQEAMSTPLPQAGTVLAKSNEGRGRLHDMTRSLDLSQVPYRWSEFNTRYACLLADRCHFLTTLSLDRCARMTNGDLGRIIDATGSTLRRLIISHCRRIDDTGIATISRCTKLVHLDCSYLDGITDASLEKIAASCRRIMRLSLAHCEFITEQSITAFRTNCPRLSYLNISGCYVMELPPVLAARTEGGSDASTDSQEIAYTVDAWETESETDDMGD